MWHLLNFWKCIYQKFLNKSQVENVTSAQILKLRIPKFCRRIPSLKCDTCLYASRGQFCCQCPISNLQTIEKYNVGSAICSRSSVTGRFQTWNYKKELNNTDSHQSSIVEVFARQYGIQSDTSSIKDPMRLLLLKYSNLGENKSPHRGLVKAIYWKLGNENASNAHSHPWRVVIDQIFEKRNDIVKYQTLPFWNRVDVAMWWHLIRDLAVWREIADWWHRHGK